MKNIIKHSITLIFILILSSCAGPQVKPSSQIPVNQVITTQPSAILRQDVFHTIGPGETLWRISKMYDVKIEDIMEANNLSSATNIEMGKEILIPNAAPLRPVIPLYKSNKWKYIIIHHSATDQGNALSLYQLHLRRGFWNGLGYHFLIDNGTSGNNDGQIEISPRWIKQQDGAHCKASGRNGDSIGICLVGNYSKENVSDKQMDSLIYIVNILKKYYNISVTNIMGHGQVPDAATECPGLRFPWERFWVRLNSQVSEKALSKTNIDK